MKKSSMLLMALAVASTSAFAQKAPKIGVVIYKFDDTFMSYVRGKIESEAKAAGVKPGGMIMLHGTPLDEEYPEWFFHTLDWTEGCIALKNDDMRELWKYVRDGTLIEIRP